MKLQINNVFPFNSSYVILTYAGSHVVAREGNVELQGCYVEIHLLHQRFCELSIEEIPQVKNLLIKQGLFAHVNVTATFLTFHVLS